MQIQERANVLVVTKHATGNANRYLRRSMGWLSQGENADDE